MIYTVTFNPALDYVVRVEDLQMGELNRAAQEAVLAGGKGVNVSVVLSNLGIGNIALGFVAGFTGRKVEELMKGMGCRTDFIRLGEGMSRINVKIQGRKDSGLSTEINGAGPEIGKEALDALMGRLGKLQAGDILVLAGSVPHSLPSHIYEDIMEYLKGRDVLVVVDAAKELLLNVLKREPFLVKPNKQELGEAFGVTLTGREEIVAHAWKLKDKGARNVLVSMGKDGALLISQDGELFERKPPLGKVVNPVGAGDSMVAGFLAGYVLTGDYGNAFLTGLAAGSASAFSNRLATKGEVRELLDKMGIGWG